MNRKIMEILNKKDIDDKFFDGLSDSNKVIVFKHLINNSEKELFNHWMVKFVNPQIFWEISKLLVKENNYDFLKNLIGCYKKIENNNEYVDNLLFDFIEKDDLYFVDYLIKVENASFESIKENELTVLNECVKNNSFKCFDYFLSKGQDVKEFDDLVFFTILEEKKYDFIPLFLNDDFILNDDIAKNFFRYGLKNNQKTITSSNLNKLINVSETLINNNKILQNKLTIELLKKGNIKQLEKNFEKGFSPIGDENEIMDCAVNLEKNNLKFIKLLLDYGGYISEEQMKKLHIDIEKEVISYPRLSKLNQKLSMNLESKNKTKSLKI